MACLLPILLLASVSALAEEGESGEPHTIRVTRKAEQPSTPGSPDHFTGRVLIDTSFRGEAPARHYGARVTFEAAARTDWHSHALGQTLIVTDGKGVVQRWGDPADTIRQGDVVWIPPGQKHWHGASPESPMTHIAMSEHPDGRSTEWMEKVSDEQYAKSIPEPKEEITEDKGQTRAQMLFGDISPKLAELTDEVLYADIWERPELSKRDRSLITVAALVAMNRPPQLESHIRLAVRNGVTEQELIETITHLAFYAGWPNAVTAIRIAKEQLAQQPSSKEQLPDEQQIEPRKP